MTNTPFKLADTVQHSQGDSFRIVGTPDVFRLAATDEPAYAYRRDSTVWVRSQISMEAGDFTLLPPCCAFDARNVVDTILAKRHLPHPVDIGTIQSLMYEAYLVGRQHTG